MTPPSRTRLREERLVLPGPPGEVLDRFETSLGRAGAFLLSRDAWSLAARPIPSNVGTPDPSVAATTNVVAGEASGEVIAGRHSPGPGKFPVGGVQIALVPVQGGASRLRAWITWLPSEGGGPCRTSSAVADFVAVARVAAEGTRADVESSEPSRDAQAAWQAQESNIRRALASSGESEAAVEARLATMRARWDATHRVADAIHDDDPPIS